MKLAPCISAPSACRRAPSRTAPRARARARRRPSCRRRGSPARPGRSACRPRSRGGCTSSTPGSGPSASSELLTSGNSRSALHARAQDERERRELDARLARLALELVARLFELGDVRFVDLRDVRDVDPARLQARAGDLLDAAERLDLDRRRTSRSRPPATFGSAPPPAAAGPAFSACLTKALTSSAVMRPLTPVPLTRAEIDAELARELANGRTGVRAREASFVDSDRQQADVRG